MASWSPSTAEPLTPSVGWGVVHLFLRAHSGPGGAQILENIEGFLAEDPNQVVAFSVMGSKADIGFMLLSPDLDALDRLTKAILAGPVHPVDSFVSVTELSEYTTTEDDERARLAADGEEDVEGKLEAWRQRMAHYHDARLHPRLPGFRVLSFYPMAKTRIPDANWFMLDFEQRKELMLGHGRVGRRYSGRILQLITGCTGLDDWEWGVTLFSNDPVAIKEIVYEMRFDEVSARYGLFGPFYTGLVMEPVDVLERVGITP